MVRVIKEAQERRNEILDAAELLFEQKGFDGCSTGDLLEKVGIARGTLYYHFKSKEEIMDALIERYNERIVARAKEAAKRADKTVLERLVLVVRALQVESASDAVMEHIHKQQNALMHQKIQNMLVSNVTPILAELAEEGNAAGVTNTPFPYQSMEMIMLYASIAFDDERNDGDESMAQARYRAFAYNVERILGAKEGSLISVILPLMSGKTRGE